MTRKEINGLIATLHELAAVVGARFVPDPAKIARLHNGR